jgi:hypothetical protein
MRPGRIAYGLAAATIAEDQREAARLLSYLLWHCA